MKTMLQGNNIHVMTQALKGGDGSHLLQGLSVVNMYSEVISGSKQVAVEVKNLTAVLTTIDKGVKVTQVVTVNVVPPVELASSTSEELDEVQGIQWTKMLVERRKEVFLKQLDLSDLEGWFKGNQVTTCTLLAEYHDIFLLELRELGCTNLAKHEIIVVDDELIKEWFWRISPPMVDEVQAHLKEILEAGTIHPSQSLWYHAVILVCKKDTGLHIYTDFCKLNDRTKKDSYPLPEIQEATESLMRVGYFSCLDLEVGFLQLAMDKALKQYTAFTMGHLEFLECKCMPFGLCNASATFQRLMQNSLGELSLMYCSIYLDDVIVFSKIEEEDVQHLHVMFSHF